VKKPASAADPLWYKDAIIYELHVRAFADSNSDGIGDFAGLLSRLDYLQDLGVTCIWLLPFFPSPLRDDGYDIANYVDVNPSYGTLNDFRAFLDAAHQRNMQVMIELVINHTSDQHPWFKAARLAQPGSAAREMYVWSSNDQLYKDARIIFTDTEKSNWTWDETAKAFYWHRFFSHQPDLNFDNPAVIEEVLKAMRFWLDMGVDALRIDAIPYLVERDGTSCENLPETHGVVKMIRAAIDEGYANRLILAEANQWPADVRPYFGDGDECHMAFHFPLMPRIYMALRQENRQPITDIMAQTPSIPDNCQWGLFLRNHDELTLEMVTDDERDYMYLAYSSDPRMRVNVGIRRRLAPLVDNNRRRIELLNSLLLSFPGTPILYYGDELGMGDNIYLGDRNGVRTPMQWSSDRNAGFSKCDPARLYFPVVMDPIYGYQVINVEAQLSDQSSLLHWTRNMIALRKLFQVFGRGTLTFLNPTNRKILAYLRDLDRGDGTHETVLCVANLSRFAQPVSLDLARYAGFEPVEMLGYVPFPHITEAPYALALAPYSFLWLELQLAASLPPPLDLPQVIIPLEEPSNESLVMALLATGWDGVIAGTGIALIESSLSAWMPRQRWFGAKTHTIQSARVIDWVELSARDNPEISQSDGSQSDQSMSPAMFFVRVDYVDGGSDTYQVPLAVSAGSAAEEIVAAKPECVVASFVSGDREAVLHDATVREDFRQGILALIEQNRSLPLSSSKTAAESLSPIPLTAQPGEAVPAPQLHSAALPESNVQENSADQPAAGVPTRPESVLIARASSAFAAASSLHPQSSHVSSAEQSNTSILYGTDFILKLFRHLEIGENPDVELGRFLTEVAHFPRIAPFLGDISVVREDTGKTTIGMLQGFVANQGDGWQWFLKELATFYLTVASLPAPEEVPVPSFLSGVGVGSVAHKYGRTSMEAAALLGRRTGEMHLALATPTTDPAFAAEPFVPSGLEDDAKRIDAQIQSTIQTLRAKLSILEESTADGAALLLSRRTDLMARANAIAKLPVEGQRIRIHGDYHLGQTLRTLGTAGSDDKSGDFVILDFEGEPARPLADRIHKKSPLKDVAGMIRSFSYAAYAGFDQFRREHSDVPTDTDRSQAWVRFWQNSVSNEFLAAYRETISPNAALLPPLQDCQFLLEAYLLEKAFYELLYELNNRPAWLPVPLAGILNL